ncbi:hypothetical protein ACTXT7_002693 [Hymenolepis weldensis]
MRYQLKQIGYERRTVKKGKSVKMSNGPFLYSEMTVESPEFKKKPPSLHLSCQSSNASLKSIGSTNDLETASIYSEESSGFKRSSDSGTVILCSIGNSPSSSFILEEISSEVAGKPPQFIN